VGLGLPSKGVSGFKGKGGEWQYIDRSAIGTSNSFCGDQRVYKFKKKIRGEVVGRAKDRSPGREGEDQSGGGKEVGATRIMKEDSLVNRQFSLACAGAGELKEKGMLWRRGMSLDLREKDSQQLTERSQAWPPFSVHTHSI